MGKRSSFAHIGKDLYHTTDPRAVEPLLPFLPEATRYHEPCAGIGALIDQLAGHGHICCEAGDVENDARYIARCAGDMFITNPPWSRTVLHSIIENLSGIAPTWLLFDADWMHTRQSIPYMKFCHQIVSVGRIKWFEDTSMSGKDNCAWFFFDRRIEGEGAVFWPRTEQPTSGA